MEIEPPSRANGYVLTVEDPKWVPEAGADWKAGSNLEITLQLRNSGPEGHMRYPGVKLSSSTPGVSVLPPVHTFYGIGPKSLMEARFSVGADVNVAAGSVTFEATVTELHCEEPKRVCPPPGPLTFTIPIAGP